MNQNFYKNCIVYVFHEKQQQQLKKWVAKCNLNYQTFAIPLMQVLAEKNRVSTQILRASPVSVTKEFWKLEGTSLLRDSFSSSAKWRDFKIVFYTHFHPHPWHFTCLLQPEAMPVSEFLMQLKSRSTTNTFGIFSLETPPWNPRFLFALQIKLHISLREFQFSKRMQDSLSGMAEDVQGTELTELTWLAESRGTFVTVPLLFPGIFRSHTVYHTVCFWG